MVEMLTTIVITNTPGAAAMSGACCTVTRSSKILTGQESILVRKKFL